MSILAIEQKKKMSLGSLSSILHTRLMPSVCPVSMFFGSDLEQQDCSDFFPVISLLELRVSLLELRARPEGLLAGLWRPRQGFGVSMTLRYEGLKGCQTPAECTGDQSKTSQTQCFWAPDTRSSWECSCVEDKA